MTYIIHHGVKGMKWGVRKSDHPLAPGYSKRQFDYDKQTHGKRAAKRINKKVSKGVGTDKARQDEYDRRAKIARARNLAILGASVAVLFGPDVMKTAAKTKGTAAYGLNNRANRKRQEAGARMARDMFADDRGLGSAPSLRLHYDPVKNAWS